MALVVGLGIAFQAPGAHADTVDLEVDAVTYRVDPDAPGQGATLVGFNQAKIARNLTIPATVTHNGTAYPVKRIGEEGLRSARLQAVTLPDGLEEIGKAAFYGNSIDDLVIPDSVAGIGEQAFMNNHMKTVVLPKKLAEIKASTFVNNNLTSIDLPADLAGAARIGNLRRHLRVRGERPDQRHHPQGVDIAGRGDVLQQQTHIRGDPGDRDIAG